jgi:hypothetical protein
MQSNDLATLLIRNKISTGVKRFSSSSLQILIASRNQTEPRHLRSYCLLEISDSILSECVGRVGKPYNLD